MFMASAAFTLIQTITRKMVPNKILRNSFISTSLDGSYLLGDTPRAVPQIHEAKRIFAEFNSSHILSKTSLNSEAFVYIHPWPNSQDGIPGSRQEIQGLDRWL